MFTNIFKSNGQLPTVSSLEDGEVGFVVPWAIFLDVSGQYKIFGYREVYKDSDLTAKIKIKRQGDKILIDGRSSRGQEWIPQTPRVYGDKIKSIKTAEMVGRI